MTIDTLATGVDPTLVVMPEATPANPPPGEALTESVGQEQELCSYYAFGRTLHLVENLARMPIHADRRIDGLYMGGRVWQFGPRQKIAGDLPETYDIKAAAALAGFSDFWVWRTLGRDTDPQKPRMNIQFRGYTASQGQAVKEQLVQGMKALAATRSKQWQDFVNSVLAEAKLVSGIDASQWRYAEPEARADAIRQVVTPSFPYGPILTRVLRSVGLQSIF